MLLDGQAYAWYDGIPDGDKDTMAKLETLFLARFQPTEGLRMAHLEKFQNRKLLPGELIDDFIDEMTRMGKRLKKTDTDILDTVTMALPPSVKSFVISKEPQNLRDVVKFARMAHAMPQTVETNACSSCRCGKATESEVKDSKIDMLCQQIGELVKTQQAQMINVTEVAQTSQSSGKKVHWQNQKGSWSNHKGQSQGSGQFRPPSFRRGQNKFSQAPAGQCTRCGKSGHSPDDCFILINKWKCHLCGGIGHLRSMCWSAKYQQ